MIRVMNFFCVALSALACLALYQVSEQTRVAHVKLAHVEHRIASEKTAMSVLQAEWSRVAAPARIQQLAETRLGLSDRPAIELSSLELLPERSAAPLGNSEVRNANAVAPIAPRDSRIRFAAIHIGN
jgi:cell division protein FtsL